MSVMSNFSDEEQNHWAKRLSGLVTEMDLIKESVENMTKTELLAMLTKWRDMSVGIDSSLKAMIDKTYTDMEGLIDKLPADDVIDLEALHRLGDSFLGLMAQSKATHPDVDPTLHNYLTAAGMALFLVTQNDLARLLDDLKGFVTDRYTFFLRGFNASVAGSRHNLNLIHSPELPPEAVLRKILNRASFDMAVIQRAISQRKNEKTREQLQRADLLAALSLSLLGKIELEIPLVKAITYFQRDTTVRLIPYSPYLLIGLPYSGIEYQFDLLGVPHEVAHHVYNHGVFEARTVKSYIEGAFHNSAALLDDSWVQKWLEEIFADIFSIFVAGPITALSIQEIMLDNEPWTLSEGNGEHPAGLIRPLIYAIALEELSDGNGRPDDFQLWANGLVHRWIKKLNRNRISPYIWTSLRNQSDRKWRRLEIKEVQKVIESVVGTMIELMGEMGLNPLQSPAPVWIYSEKHDVAAVRGKIRDEWVKSKAPIPSSISDLAELFGTQEEELQKIPTKLLDDLVKQIELNYFRFDVLTFVKHIDDIADRLKVGQADVKSCHLEIIFQNYPSRFIRPDQWMPFYEANGWIDRGTQGSTRPVGGHEDGDDD